MSERQHTNDDGTATESTRSEKPSYQHDGGSTDEFTIHAPDRSRGDEPVQIRMTGVKPRSTVEFEATLVDDDGNEFRSCATFTTDDEGIVDLSKHAPESGSYDGVESMGWLWSMCTKADVWFPRLEKQAVSIDLRATAGGKQAERTIARIMGDERVCRQAVDHDELAGALFHPSGDGPYPAVIALHGSGGYRPEGIARRLATRGYVTLALQYFSEEDVLPEKLREIPLAYFDTAAEWLLEQPTVKGDQAGLVGISRGAEAALLLGTRFDWVGCVVSYSGSGVAWDTPHDDPAWIHDGEPVPHLTAEENPMTRMRRGVDEDRIERAAMAVEKTDGPILLLSGGEDRVWPARRLSNIAVDRLDTADFEYMFEHLTYDDVGHLLAFPSYMPLGNVAEEPTMLKAMARATADSWPTVLEYLARGLDADETQAVRTEEEFEVVEGMLGED